MPAAFHLHSADSMHGGGVESWVPPKARRARQAAHQPAGAGHMQLALSLPSSECTLGQSFLYAGECAHATAHGRHAGTSSKMHSASALLQQWPQDLATSGPAVYPLRAGSLETQPSSGQLLPSQNSLTSGSHSQQDAGFAPAGAGHAPEVAPF